MKRNIKMADTELRANSLRIRFERGVPEPTDSEIFKFMKAKMGLNSEKLLSMYKDKSETSIIIKFKRAEDMRNTLRDLPGTMVFEYNKYESTEVKLSSANAIVRYVRLFNLPPEIEDREISTVMVRFGKIVRMVREKYGEETGFPIWTSVRGVYLELKEGIEIPATIYIRNLRARVVYEGLVNKCYLCGSQDHLKADCPQKRSVNERMQEHQVSSYSGILKGGERWSKQVQAKTSSGDGMVSLGQGLPKRTKAVQQLPDNSEGATQAGEGSGHREEQRNDVDDVVDQQPLANGHNDMCTDELENVCPAASENDFIKVTSKRARKQKPNCSNKDSASDSDEHPTGKIHQEQIIVQSSKGGVLSESLDRVTRSRAKQMKVSDLGECSIEIGASEELKTD